MITLRQRMAEDMRVRNYAARTRDVYIDAVAKYVAYFGKPPARLGPNDIRTYQVHLVHEKHASWTVLNQAVCALRFFYGTTLGKDWVVRHIPYAKREKKLPVVLSRAEVEQLLERVDSSVTSRSCCSRTRAACVSPRSPTFVCPTSTASAW